MEVSDRMSFAQAIQIPGYEIHSLLGVGGTASVYDATQISLQRSVALKVLTDPRSRDFIDRFIKEGQIVASLNHPNIATIYDIGHTQDALYMSMERLEDNLRDRNLHGLPPDVAIGIVGAIAEALRCAHARGVIHRDIKPSNILFRSDGTPVLCDFGVAKRQEGDEDFTLSGEVVGTPHYMSPEQACGEDPEPRHDVYSLGAVLFEMLTGKRPYRANSDMAVLYKQVHDPVPELPDHLQTYQTLLNRMMAKDLQERHPHTEALLADLEHYGYSPTHAMAVLPTGRPKALPVETVSKRSGLMPGIGKQSPLTGFRSRRQILLLFGTLILMLVCIAWWHFSPTPAVYPPASSMTAASRLEAQRLFVAGETFRDNGHLRESFASYLEAAQLGHPQAQYELGRFYGEGRFVQQDYSAAAKWFEAAARQNVVQAQHLLCLAYGLGRGVPLDRTLAYAWCTLAQKQGHKDSRSALKTLRKFMRNEDIQAARALADTLNAPQR